MNAPRLATFMLLTSFLTAPGAVPAAPASLSALDVVRNRPHAILSSAAFRMWRDYLERGGQLPTEVIRRFGLDVPEEDFSAPAAADALRPGARLERVEVVAMLSDTRANDKSADATCSACSFRPLGQSETTIAAIGSTLLAGWNDTKGFCPPNGPVQGWGLSTDGGATWTDLGDPPSPIPGGRYRGDPVHAANPSTGDFFLCGLYEDPVDGTQSGVAVLRCNVVGNSVNILNNKRIAVGGNNFLDKEWLAVDPASGTLYVTYTNFVGYVFGPYMGSQIELIRSTDGGLTWSAPQVLSAPAGAAEVQGSRPAVGPSGELYVVWWEYGYPQSVVRIRKSVNGGLSFGPLQTVASAFENFWSGAPGFRRGGGVNLPSIAVDNSAGPHSGRVHVAWPECLDFSDTFFSLATARSEVENNSFFLNATPFTVGNVLRGTLATTADVDLFKFTGAQGQTVFITADSVGGCGINMRVVCASDTSNFNNLRLLAYNFQNYPTLLFTLPASGTYYLRLNSGNCAPAGYRLLTAFDPVTPGQRGRDHRDAFAAWSDDGATWSTPVRLNDDSPWFDNEFPELTVDEQCKAHAYWHDWRDDTACGAESYEYMTSSGNGGLSWGPNRRVSDERSFWSFNTCGSANQGDYQGITSVGSTVHLCWGDSRLGDPDPWTDHPRFLEDGVCPPPLIASPGGSPALSFALQNLGNVDGQFSWKVEDSSGWLMGAAPSVSGTAGLVAGGSQPVTATFQVPSDCVPPATMVRFITWDNDIPGCVDTCTTTITCDMATAAEVSLVQADAAAGRVRLEWQTSDPALSAVLERGTDGGAWEHLAALQADGGRLRFEDAGVRGGTRYGYRLSWEQEGATRRSAEVWVQVPAARFALYGARPNPSVRGLWVSMSLADGPPARLEVLDVSGRRLLALDCRGRNPGAQVIQMPGAARLESGVYLLRLTQGSRRATSRFTFVR